MKEIILNMTSVDIKSKVKKSRANWSMQMVQDLNSYHGVSLEKELERILRIEKRKNSIKNIFS